MNDTLNISDSIRAHAEKEGITYSTEGLKVDIGLSTIPLAKAVNIIALALEVVSLENCPESFTKLALWDIREEEQQLLFVKAFDKAYTDFATHLNGLSREETKQFTDVWYVLNTYVASWYESSCE